MNGTSTCFMVVAAVSALASWLFTGDSFELEKVESCGMAAITFAILSLSAKDTK